MREVPVTPSRLRAALLALAQEPRHERARVVRRPLRRPAGRPRAFARRRNAWPPTRCAAKPARCCARSARGKLGACDRYGNVDGTLTRLDTLALVAKPGIDLVAWNAAKDGQWDGSLRRRRRAGVRLRRRLGHHLSRLQAGALHRRLEARRRRHGDRRHRRHLQLLQLQGEDRHRPLSRPRAGDGAASRRGGRPRQHDRIRLAIPGPRRRAPPHRRLEEGRPHRLRDDDGARQPRAGGIADRRRRAVIVSRRPGAGRRRRRGAAHARRLRLGDDRHLRAAMVRPCRRGGRRRRSHHRRALRAPGRQVPRHGAFRHPPARPQVDAGALLPGRQSRAPAGAAPTSPIRSRSSKAGRRSTARGRACAC